MNSKYEIRCLADAFYKAYPQSKYPEMEKKQNRPFLVLLLRIEGNTFAIPFRTNIRHRYCYKFRNSGRATNSTTGLDYTKAVIVNRSDYIGPLANVDHNEFLELDKHYYWIYSQFSKYVEGYKKYIKDSDNQYMAKRYRYSTLKYFHAELGLN